MDGNQTEKIHGVEIIRDVINKTFESSGSIEEESIQTEGKEGDGISNIEIKNVESGSKGSIDELVIKSLSDDSVDITKHEAEEKKECSDENSLVGTSIECREESDESYLDAESIEYKEGSEESPVKDKSTDGTVMIVDDTSRNSNDRGEDKVESMDFTALLPDNDGVEGNTLADSGVTNSEESKTEMESTKPESSVVLAFTDSDTVKSAGSSRNSGSGKGNSNTGDVEHTSNRLSDVIQENVTPSEGGISKDKEKGSKQDCDGDEIVELPIQKKPAEVVDLSDEEDEDEKDMNSDINKRIKLRSLASLVDAGSEDASGNAPVPGVLPDHPAIGEIVEHGVIIGSDEMDGLQLRISNVVGGEDCITGLSMDEDRDSFSSIQISSVTTLIDPMSPEDPNKDSDTGDKPDESEKSTTDAAGVGESEKTDALDSEKATGDSLGKTIQIVHTENLASKDGADKSSESTELQEASKESVTTVVSPQKVPTCVYHILRSILTVDRECLVCGKKSQCEFRVTKKGESGTWAFLCSAECRTSWTASLPSDHQIEKPRLIFEKLCGMCGKDLSSHARGGQFSWETREFCSRKCLTVHLKEVASECHMCHDEVRPMFIGKYCVRFGSDIHQFCSNGCLERYKTKIRVCCYCQKNLDKVERVSSLTNKEYCSMKCLKRAQRRDIGQQNYAEQHPCTVCLMNGINKYEFLSNQESLQLCLDPCLNVYKYANRVKAVSCCLCFRVMNAEDVGHYLYHGGHQLRVFCSDSCVNVFILSARKIVVCNCCKVKKYNFDMIHRQVDEDFRDFFYCSLNCLNTKEPILGPGTKNSSDVSSSTSVTATTVSETSQSESSESTITMCNMCEKMAKPQYHMVMSDNTLRSFCRYSCAHKYKNTFGFQINGIQSSDSAQPNNLVSVLRPKNTQSMTEKVETTSKTKKNAVNDVTQNTAAATAELLKLLTPPVMVNKITSCRPATLTKGVYCKPHPWHRSTQTEQSGADNVAPRSGGALTSSQIRELLDLGGPLSDRSSESEVGGFSENEGDSDSSDSDKEDGTKINSTRKRKATSHLEEPARKSQKIDGNCVTSLLTDSSHLPSPRESPQQSWEWDFSSKFTPVCRVFDDSCTGVSQGCCLRKDSSELDFFCMFIDREIVEHICQETQRHYKQKQEYNKVTDSSKNSDWHEPSVAEMYSFLGLTMVMAHIRKSSLKEYWTSDLMFSTPIFHQVMQRSRYVDILKFLHFVNNNETNSCDNLAKIRPILDNIKDKFRKTFKPSQDIAIEDSLQMFWGQFKAKHYFSKKQFLCGRRCFVMTDLNTNIMVDIVGCTGSDAEITSSDPRNGADVIKKLLSDQHNKNHTLYLDHWYTSPALFESLYQQGIGAVGLVRPDQNGMPCFERVKKGATISAHTQNILAIKWQEVHMLSTVHDDVMVNTGKCDRVTGEAVRKPKVVVDYRKKRRVVDYSDSLLTSTACVQTCKKWYKKFFFHLLDIVVFNSYHLYLTITCNKLSLLDFRRNVIQQLFERYLQARTTLDLVESESPLHRLDAHLYPSCITSKSSEMEGLC